MLKTELAFVGLGSNLGNGRQNLLAAWQRLGEIPGIEILRLSSPYLTEPLGIVTEHWFTNAVGEIRTGLQPEALLAHMLQIEEEMGRNRSMTDDRPVDLDLLYFADLVLRSETLTLPHPALSGRLFVLAPLAELAPALLHPLLGQTTLELLRECEMPGRVERQEWLSAEGEM